MIASSRLRLLCHLSRLAAVVAVLGAAIPRAEARRIGFANIARDGQAARTAIDANRTGIVRKAGGDEVAEGSGRAALEDPVSAGSEDAATLERARGLVVGARASLKEFAYDEALDQLRQADATLRVLLPSPEVMAQLYEVVLLAGQIYAAKGDETLALGAFQLARRLAPDKTALDPARYRPQIVALYARAGTAEEATGGLHVITEPPGATVYLDGRVAGVSPLELAAVSAGDHYLGLGLDGHVSRHERIAVAKGTRMEQSYLLARLPAEQRARSLRAGLARPGLAADDYRRGAAALADVASVDVLVLVRDKDGGGVEAAAWDVHAGKLGRWVGLADGGVALAASLPAPDAAAIAVPAPREVAGRLSADDLSGKDRRGDESPRWYRTWWGVSALIAGGVVVTGVILAATSSSGGTGTPDSLIINNPHWADGSSSLRGASW